jgi:hypothetical protein
VVGCLVPRTSRAQPVCGLGAVIHGCMTWRGRFGTVVNDLSGELPIDLLEAIDRVVAAAMPHAFVAASSAIVHS